MLATIHSWLTDGSGQQDSGCSWQKMFSVTIRIRQRFREEIKLQRRRMCLKGLMMTMAMMILLVYTTRARKCNGCLHSREAEVLVAAHQHARHPQLSQCCSEGPGYSGCVSGMSPHWETR